MDPIDNGAWYLGLKVKGTVIQYPFFVHNSLLTSILYISALLYSIKLKFDMPLTYALSRIVVEFHKNQMGDDVIVTSFTILHTNVHISNSSEPTNFIFGTTTNIQQHKIHLMITVQVTLTKAVGHRRR